MHASLHVVTSRNITIHVPLHFRICRPSRSTSSPRRLFVACEIDCFSRCRENCVVAVVVFIAGSIFEVLVVWLIVASGEGGWHLLSGQRTAERTRTSGRRAIHANFCAPRFVSLLDQVLCFSECFPISKLVVLCLVRSRAHATDPDSDESLPLQIRQSCHL